MKISIKVPILAKERYADIIVPQDGNNLVAIDILSNIIMDRLKKQ